tara:strand:+ start:631 stop:903 length:273 start_codon:yes stop_codon:yes gene_type:complete
MAIIVIAYNTYEVNGKTVRIYDDSTEIYFESAEIQDAKDYIDYLSSSKGYTVDTSEVIIHKQGEFDVDTLFRDDALAKLSEKEKEILGLN